MKTSSKLALVLILVAMVAVTRHDDDSLAAPTTADSPSVVAVSPSARGRAKPSPDVSPAGKKPAEKKHAPAKSRPTTKASVTKAGSNRPRTVALTFDDGPSRYTPQVLDILRRHRVQATFCMLGANVGQYRRTAQRVVREGHRLCNHSYDHRDFTTLSDTAARAQVVRTQRKIRSVTGRNPRTFRFPYGASDQDARAVIRSEGLRILGWSVDTHDWRRPGADAITDAAVRKARPGAVVLMHDGGGDRSQTVASLDDTIRRFKSKGYTFVLA